MITLKDLGVLPERSNTSGYTIGHGHGSHSHAIDCSRNTTIDEIERLDLTAALKKAGYVKLEEEMLTDKILKRKNIKSEYQQVSILVARWAIQEIIIDNLKSLLKVAK